MPSIYSMVICISFPEMCPDELLEVREATTLITPMLVLVTEMSDTCISHRVDTESLLSTTPSLALGAHLFHSSPGGGCCYATSRAESSSSGKTVLGRLRVGAAMTPRERACTSQ